MKMQDLDKFLKKRSLRETKLIIKLFNLAEKYNNLKEFLKQNKNSMKAFCKIVQMKSIC